MLLLFAWTRVDHPQLLQHALGRRPPQARVVAPARAEPADALWGLPGKLEVLWSLFIPRRVQRLSLLCSSIWPELYVLRLQLERLVRLGQSSHHSRFYVVALVLKIDQFFVFFLNRLVQKVLKGNNDS